MKNLWGGRFKKLPNKKLKIFNNSFYFDKRLIEEDILYSKKHVNSIYLAKIITKKERDLIIDVLDKILVEYSNKINKNNYKYEDIHTFVELKLFEKIGDLAKKLHTGRSRNDQIATDIKLYIKKEILNIDSLLFLLLKNLECIIEKNTNVIMPGFTHMQKAQPIILSQYIDAYFEMFKRDRFRLKYLINSINTCPAGSGALTGTVYKINREYLASELGFLSPVKNSIDGVSDRDFIIEFLSYLSIIMMHLSRFCEEIICWNSDEYRFIEISDAYSTGSSIMPQKKNPDIAELIRGKTGRVYGDLINILTVMKALPLAYNKDMQEDKECVFDGIDTVKTCLDILYSYLISYISKNKKVRK